MKKVFVSLVASVALVAVMAVPAMAVEENRTATVTVKEFVSVTITDPGAAGLQFGELDPGAVKAEEANKPAINIAAAAENNGDAEVFLKGTDFASSGNNFGVGNAFYHDSDASGDATAMTSDYPGTAWKTLAPAGSVDIYHWLSIPVGQEPGAYESTFTYKAG